MTQPVDVNPPDDLGPLVNPLYDWDNYDILATKEARAHFDKKHPGLLPVFYWPELVDTFLSIDKQANAHRKLTRKWGVRATIIGFAGLLATALTPVVARADSGLLSPLVFGLLAAFLAAASGLIGYWSAYKGRSKRRWLANRFWTERMRQLHFQFIANNLDLAVRAVIDEEARKEWNEKREEAFSELKHSLTRSVAEAMQRMLDDLAEAQAWLVPNWLPPPPAPSSSPELSRILTAVQEQRFGIQTEYPRRKLRPGIYSSRWRANAVRIVSELFTVAALILAIVTGLLLAGYGDAEAFSVKLLIAIAGAMSAGVLTLRMLDEGLQLKSEAERYEWYLAAVQSLEGQFEVATDAGKIAALREMERISYQELRWFTDTFYKARFVL